MWFPSSAVLRRVGPAVLAVALVGCGSDEGNGPTGPEGSFSISAPPSLTVEAGSSGTVQVTITRSGGFANAVTLTLEDHPRDLTHDIPAAYGTTSSVTLEFTAGASMAPGTYAIKACGRALGMATQCAEISLTVVRVPAGEFTLSLDPPSTTLAAGQTGTVTITLTRKAPFAGPVALDIATFSQHSGVTFVFEPAVIPAGSTGAILTIAVGADAEPMEYDGWNTLFVVGKSGDLRHDVRLFLTVTHPPMLTLALEPATLSLAPGEHATVAITVTRAATFTEPVALDIACWCETPGVTFTFDPAVIPGGANGATATITAAANAPPFVYTGEGQLWIVGISPSGLRYDAIFYLTVTAP